MRPSRARAYIIAVVSVAAATGVKIALSDSLGEDSPFALYGVAILVSGALGGGRSALSAGVLATLAGWYFFARSHDDFALDDGATALRMLVLLAEAFVISALVAGIDHARDSAQAAAKRVERLQSFTSAFASAVTPLDVAHATVRKAVEALGAATGMFAQLRPDGDLEIIAVQGVTQDQVAGLQVFSASSPNPAAVAFKRGQPEWVEGMGVYAKRYPEMHARFQIGHGALAALPLSVVERKLGVIAIGFDETREFSRSERQLLVTLASQAAQSLERAQAFSDEVRLRRRLEQLNELMQALSNALSKSEVAEIVVTRAMKLAAADTCTLYMLEPDGTLALLGDRGVSADVLPAVQRITRDSDNPVMRTIRSRETLWAENFEQYVAQYPALAQRPSTGRRAHAFWSAPLVAEGASIGLLGMGFYAPRLFPPEERELVALLVKHCAQALRRAERLESERASLEVSDRLRSSFETTLRSIGDAVIATDQSGHVTLMNHVAEELTGWPERDAKGQPLREVFRILNEHTRAVVESPVDRVLREGVVVGLANHTVVLHRNGQRETPIDDSGAPIRGPGGGLDGVVLVFRDVSSKKREELQAAFLADASAALSESLDYRATLARVASMAVPKLADYCIVHLAAPDGSLERVALAHADPIKLAEAIALSERYPLDVWREPSAPRAATSALSRWFAQISDDNLQAIARDPEHLRALRGLSFSSSISVPLLARGQVLGMLALVWAQPDKRYDADDVVFAENVAQRCAMTVDNMRLYAAEQRARQSADLANRSKDEFLAIMGHELRNPLAPMVSAVHLMKLRQSGNEDKELAVLERQLRHMLRLLEDLLDLSRVVRDRVELTRRVVEIREVVASAVEVAAPLIHERQQQLTLEVPETGLCVDVDSVRIAQVLGNLLTNAAKYTERGGQIRVHAALSGDTRVAVSVQDNGIGIEPDLMPRLFELFSQGKQSIDRQLGGLGIGLAIASRLVKEHGGTLTAHSDGPKRGSRFTVELPRATRPAEREPAPSPALTPARHKKRVLIVDDNEDSSELMALLIQKLGHDTCVALEGAQALALASEYQPEVVFLDIGLPGMNGFEVARRMRQIPGCETIPIVAVTGYARESDRQEAAAAGFSEHFAKPIAFDRLRSVLETIGG
jgi:PAS domain S-box-containing protein